MLLKLLIPLIRLHSQEHSSQQHRQNQEYDERLTASYLRRMHGQHHGETAAQEHRRIYSADDYVQGVAGGREHLGEQSAVNHVGEKQAAEEHHLPDKEDAHPQGGGFLLLPWCFELLPQCDSFRVAIQLSPPPARRNRTLPW